MVNNMKIYKYHSCENSFIVLEFQKKIAYDKVSKFLCEKYDVDGMIVVKVDPVTMLFYNKDGSKAKMCGNGIRVVMHYFYDKFGIYKHLDIKTDGGIFTCEVINKDPFISAVSLGMGEYKDNIIKQSIMVKGKEFIITLFELGVLHLVALSNDFSEDEKYIVDLFNHPLLDEKYNINLVKPINSNVFEILTYEKGVGFTKACGTGAASSAYILNTEYGMNNDMIAICPGGLLKIDILDEIILTGESMFVSSYEETI